MRPLPLALALLLALGACARDAAAPPAASGPSFRTAGAPIGSTTRGTLADLRGDWVIAQAYPGPAWTAPGTRLTVDVQPQDAAVLRFAGPAASQEIFAAATGPGRLAPAEGPELWVLWVDDDFRTAVVGTPDGTLGWIMNRPGAASSDRTAAAREILDFNGYDLDRLPAAG